MKPSPSLTYVLTRRIPAILAHRVNTAQVNDAVMKKVIEWCEHHQNDPPASQDDDSDSRKKSTDIEEWDQKFMQVDQEMLFEIILVRFFASHINIIFADNCAGRQLP
jgi:hypothetical protein